MYDLKFHNWASHSPQEFDPNYLGRPIDTGEGVKDHEIVDESKLSKRLVIEVMFSTASGRMITIAT